MAVYIQNHIWTHKLHFKFINVFLIYIKKINSDSIKYDLNVQKRYVATVLLTLISHLKYTMMKIS